MDVTFRSTAAGRIKSALIVSKQLQEGAWQRIASHAGLPDLIAHRIHHGLDIPRNMVTAHEDLQEAEEDFERARQGEANLRSQFQRLGGK
jgi:hypothetical protein